MTALTRAPSWAHHYAPRRRRRTPPRSDLDFYKFLVLEGIAPAALWRVFRLARVGYRSGASPQRRDGRPIATGSLRGGSRAEELGATRVDPPEPGARPRWHPLDNARPAQADRAGLCGGVSGPHRPRRRDGRHLQARVRADAAAGDRLAARERAAPER